MAVFYIYNYFGGVSGPGTPTVNTGQRYYTEVEYQNLAFTIDFATNYDHDVVGRRAFFSISSGSVTPGTIYYNDSFGYVLAVGSGTMVASNISGLDSNTISGIGTYVGPYPFTAGCYYERNSTGTLAPSKFGYVFTPSSENITGSPAIAEFTAVSTPTPPIKANTPVPTNANTSVTLDQATLGWVDGGGADTFDVYYGTVSGSLTLVSSAQAGTSFTVTGITNGAPYAYLSVRYWRIDSTNDAGTTTGDEWSFTTIRFTPISKTYFYSTTGQYYRLLIQSDGTYGDPPGVGVENTDFVYLAAGYEANFVATNRRLVSAANSKIWYEDI